MSSSQFRAFGLRVSDSEFSVFFCNNSFLSRAFKKVWWNKKIPKTSIGNIKRNLNDTSTKNTMKTLTKKLPKLWARYRCSRWHYGRRWTLEISAKQADPCCWLRPAKSSMAAKLISDLFLLIKINDQKCKNIFLSFPVSGFTCSFGEQKHVSFTQWNTCFVTFLKMFIDFGVVLLKRMKNKMLKEPAAYVSDDSVTLESFGQLATLLWGVDHGQKVIQQLGRAFQPPGDFQQAPDR